MLKYTLEERWRKFNAPFDILIVDSLDSNLYRTKMDFNIKFDDISLYSLCSANLNRARTKKNILEQYEYIQANVLLCRYCNICYRFQF